MFLSLTFMTRNYNLIITYLGISMLYLCRITHGMLGWVLSSKLLNQLPKKCLFSWYFKVLHFSPILVLSGVYFSFQQSHLPVIKVPAQNPTAQPGQGIVTKSFETQNNRNIDNFWNSEHLQQYELSKEKRVLAFPVLQLFCEISNSEGTSHTYFG